MISIEDLAKIDIRIGKILSAEFVEGADKLIRFEIDLGEEMGPRQILSGVRMHYPDPAELVGRFVPVVANLAPRTIRGLESNGMILYGIVEGDESSILCTIEPTKPLAPGAIVR